MGTAQQSTLLSHSYPLSLLLLFWQQPQRDYLLYNEEDNLSVHKSVHTSLRISVSTTSQEGRAKRLGPGAWSRPLQPGPRRPGPRKSRPGRPNLKRPGPGGQVQEARSVRSGPGGSEAVRAGGLDPEARARRLVPRQGLEAMACTFGLGP